MHILKKINIQLRIKINTFRNIIFFLKSKRIIAIEDSGIVLRGGNISDLDKIEMIYKTLNKSELPYSIKVLLKCCSEKFIIVAEKEFKNKLMIVGIDLFYLNPRDFIDGTVHEGFIGVIPEFEGQGIATQMRLLAKQHFRDTDLNGISTRISKHNLGSLNSARKLGFKPIEDYFDALINEDRYYLICNLKEEK